MKKAHDFRRIARECLKGNWGIALLAGLVASALGASSGTSINFDFETTKSGVDIPVVNLFRDTVQEMPGVVFVVLFVFIIFVLVIAAVSVVLGSVVDTGYSKFNLNIVDKKELSAGTLFEYFKVWKKTTGVALLKGLYIFLLSCLFVVPGIIATYSYNMTSFILAEDSSIGIREALKRSEEMMQGNRWRLFCLEFSFIGWAILCGLTLGIGMLWLNPYINASRAAFYREISGTEQIIEYEAE